MSLIDEMAAAAANDKIIDENAMLELQNILKAASVHFQGRPDVVSREDLVAEVRRLAASPIRPSTLSDGRSLSDWIDAHL
jgi:hypothetical protein